MANDPLSRLFVDLRKRSGKPIKAVTPGVAESPLSARRHHRSFTMARSSYDGRERINSSRAGCTIHAAVLLGSCKWFAISRCCETRLFRSHSCQQRLFPGPENACDTIVRERELLCPRGCKKLVRAGRAGIREHRNSMRFAFVNKPQDDFGATTTLTIQSGGKRRAKHLNRGS